MTVSIHIEAPNAVEAARELETLARALTAPTTVAQAAAEAAPAVEPAPQTTEAQQPTDVDPPAKRGRGRPPKIAVPETASGVTDIDANGNPVPEVTKDDIKAAVMKLNSEKGENACWALFHKYGAKNTTTAFESGKGAEFIAEAQRMVEMTADELLAAYPKIREARKLVTGE